MSCALGSVVNTTAMLVLCTTLLWDSHVCRADERLQNTSMLLRTPQYIQYNNGKVVSGAYMTLLYFGRDETIYVKIGNGDDVIGSSDNQSIGPMLPLGTDTGSYRYRAPGAPSDNITTYKVTGPLSNMTIENWDIGPFASDYYRWRVEVRGPSCRMIEAYATETPGPASRLTVLQNTLGNVSCTLYPGRNLNPG